MKVDDQGTLCMLASQDVLMKDWDTDVDERWNFLADGFLLAEDWLSETDNTSFAYL